MKKTFFKLVLSMLTVLTLSFTAFTFAGCKTEDNNSLGSSFEFNNNYSNGITLKTLNTVIIDDEQDKYLEQILTATITSTGNVNDVLNWSVYWNDSLVTANIDEYLTVTTDVVNDKIASVKCFKNFENFGTATVEVKSSIDDNVKATCIVSYVGEPTSLMIKDGSNVLSGNTITLSEGAFVDYDLVLESLLGAGKKFSDYDLKVKLSGWFELYCYTYSNNVVVEENTAFCAADGSSNFELETSIGKQNVSISEFIDFNNYFAYTFKDGELVLKSQEVTGKLYNGLNGKESYNGKVYPTNGVKAKLIDYDITFNFSITEKVSNLTTAFNIKVKADLSNMKIDSIILDKYNIAF